MVSLNSCGFIAFGLFLFLTFQVAEGIIKCPLVWEKSATGDAVPNNVLPVTSDTEQLIVRGQTSSDSSGEYSIGRYEAGKGYFPVNASKVEKLNTFEILTNPHGCVTIWKFANTNGPHQIPSHSNSNKYVGRTAIFNFGFGFSILFISGQVNGVQITFADTYTSSSSSFSFQVLESYSYGLTLKLRNFIFADDAFNPTNEFVGIDMIFNHADTEIKQTITQSKSILQRITTTSSSTWNNAFDISMSIEPEMKLESDDSPVEMNLPMPYMELSYQREDSWENAEKLVDEKEVVIEVSREVTVPPYTSVQVCSTVTVCNNFNVPYIARAEYTAPGLKAGEVKNILGKGRIEGPLVVVDNYEGTLQGSLPVVTKFYVSEIDAPFGCSGMSKKIADLKRDLAFNRINKFEFDERNSKINKIIHNWN